MSGVADAPWWSSGEGAPDHLDDLDPVEAHRAARRGAHLDDDHDHAHDHTHDHDERDAGPDGRVGAHDVCAVCPLCTGARLLETVRPDLLGHLADAARSLLAAGRVLLDHPAAPHADGPRPTRDDPPDGSPRTDDTTGTSTDGAAARPRVTRIDVD